MQKPRAILINIISITHVKPKRTPDAFKRALSACRRGYGNKYQ